MNMILQGQFGKMIEVSIDNMVVKSHRRTSHLDNMEDIFKLLESFNMRINRVKSISGVRYVKFFGYLITKIGIEANPNQDKSS